MTILRIEGGGGGRRCDPLENVLIRLLEQAFQCPEIAVVKPVQSPADESLEQEVELLHAAPATPARPLEPRLPSARVRT